MRSLDEQALEKREPKWRQLEDVLERLGELPDRETKPAGRPRALTARQEAEVLQRAREGDAIAALAERFGVSRSVVQGVLRRAREGK